MWKSHKISSEHSVRLPKNLTVVSNNAGVDDFGLGLLLQRLLIISNFRHLNDKTTKMVYNL